MTISGGIFDFDTKAERLVEVTRELEDPNVWNDPDNAQKLGQERSSLERIVKTLSSHSEVLDDAKDLLELAVEENDEDTFNAVNADLDELEKGLEKLEFQRMFSGKLDANSAYLDIQSGSGGTEAQDWANIILRMYLRWGEAQGYKVTLMEVSEGEVAGIKSATVRFEGEYAFGMLRTETGVHRLVRKSPFDSGARRHTSLIRLIYVLIPTAQVVRVVSTLTPPTQRYVLLTYRPTLWCNVRWNAHSIKTVTRR